MTPTFRSVVSRALVVGLIVAVAGACGQRRSGEDPDAPTLPVDRPFPALDLVDINGRPVRSADLIGKIVVVNFWATWCGPCEQEFPALVELQTRYPDDVSVIGMAIDEAPVETIRAFATRHRTNFPIVVATAETAELFGGLMGLPTTFVARTDRQLSEAHVGYATLEVFEALITRARKGLQR